MIHSSQVVVAVWREDSLTGAAERLGLSVATVSRRLSDLEDELGVLLFERSTRSLRATPAGEALARRLERGLAEVEVALRSVTDSEQKVSGTVRLTIPPNLSTLFAPMFSRFQEQHPEVRLHVYVSERRLTYAEEDIDVMIRVGRLESERLVAKELLRYRHVLCATPQVARAITCPSRLEKAPHLVWGHPSARASWRLSSPGKEDIDAGHSEIFLCNDYSLLESMLKEGRSVGELPAFLFTNAAADGLLERVLPDYELEETTLSILFGTRLLPLVVRRFVDHIRSEFASPSVTESFALGPESSTEKS